MDGTGVRDYIHVVDLAKGHVKALKKIEEKAGLCVYNLGTGSGYSVLDIVKNFEAATLRRIAAFSSTRGGSIEGWRFILLFSLRSPCDA